MAIRLTSSSSSGKKPSHSKAKSPSTRGLSEEEAARLRSRIRWLIDQPEYGSQTALAKALAETTDDGGAGASQKNLSAFLSGTTTGGLKLARAVAKPLSLSIDQVLGAPQMGIDQAVIRHPGRWSALVIAVVRAMAGADRMTTTQAIEALDAAKKALAPVLAKFEK